MMTYEKVMEMAMALGEDAVVCSGDGWIDVEIQDFGGFDEDFGETPREYDDEEAVDGFLQMLDDECVSRGGDLYVDFHFDGFTVQLGFSSFEV